MLRRLLLTAVATPVALALVAPAAAAETTTEPVAPTVEPREPGRIVTLDARPDLLASAVVEPVDVLFIGDSITHGGFAPDRSSWWVDRTRRHLQGAYGGAGVGYLPVGYPFFAEYAWATAGGYDVSTAGLGLRAHLLDSAGDSAEVSVTGTGLQLFFATGPNRGTMRVVLDGVEAALVETSTPTAGSATWATGPLAGGEHRVRVEAADDRGVLLEGVAVFDGDETSGVRTWDSGHAGFGTTHFAEQRGWAASAAAADPELVVIELGTNDYAFELSAETFEANLTRIVDDVTAASTGPVSIVLLPMWLGSGRDAARYGRYVDVQHRLAAERGLTVVDLSAEEAALLTDDGIHPNAFGQRVITDRLLDTIDPAYVAPATPAPATEVVATGAASGDSITATWTGSESGGVAGYVVRAVETNGAGTVAAQQRVGTTTATLGGLAPGKSYVVEVRAEGEAALSAPATSPAVALTSVTPPTAPAGVVATAQVGAATVSWTAPDGTVSGYLVQTFDLATGFIGQQEASTTSATVGGLLAGRSYAFLVYAHNAGGYSAGAASNEVTIPMPTAKPTSVVATARAGGADVRWTAPAGTVTGYLVQTFDTVSGFVGQQEVAGTSATVTGLSPGRSYAFLVYASGPGGWSDGAPSNTITVPAPPSPPTNVTATAKKGGATVGWAPPASGPVTGYVVRTYDVTSGSTLVASQDVSSTARSLNVGGLRGGRRYQFVVLARNTAGLSAPASSPIVAVR